MNKQIFGLYGAFASIAGNIISKSLTFILNIYITRNSGPELLGIGQMSLGLITILSLSMNRLCFRRTALKRPDYVDILKKDFKDQNNELWFISGVNCCWLSVVFSFFITFILYFIWISKPPSSIIAKRDLLKEYNLAVLVVCISSIFEILAEPLLYFIISDGHFFIKAIIETVSNISRSLFLVYSTISWSNSTIILSYSFSQLSYSIVLLTLTYIFHRYLSINYISFNTLLPQRIKCGQSLLFILPYHKDYLRRLFMMALQSIVTDEIDKLLLLYFFNNQDWSTYSVIFNLANAVVRIFFAPIEDMALTQFCTIKVINKKDDKTENIIKEKYWETYNSFLPLRQFLFIELFLGIAVISLGCPLAYEILFLLYGKYWTNQEIMGLFKLQIYNIFLLSLNGIMETYFYSQANSQWLVRFQKLSVASFIIRLALIVTLHSRGTVLFAYSNGIILICKICFEFLFLYLQLEELCTKYSNIKWSNQNKIYKCIRVYAQLLIQKRAIRTFILTIFAGLIFGYSKSFISNKIYDSELDKILYTLYMGATTGFIILATTFNPILKIMRNFD
ncbi:putative oligosaccharide translocation protein RFT1 [Cryptosporidium serpentis]